MPFNLNDTNQDIQQKTVDLLNRLEAVADLLEDAPLMPGYRLGKNLPNIMTPGRQWIADLSVLADHPYTQLQFVCLAVDANVLEIALQMDGFRGRSIRFRLCDED